MMLHKGRMYLRTMYLQDLESGRVWQDCTVPDYSME